jgi:hypothetical protein
VRCDDLRRERRHLVGKRRVGERLPDERGDIDDCRDLDSAVVRVRPLGQSEGEYRHHGDREGNGVDTA